MANSITTLVLVCLRLLVADECRKDTIVGHCLMVGCFMRHGPAQCDKFNCVCKEGYCSYDGHTCVAPPVPTPLPTPHPTFAPVPTMFPTPMPTSLPTPAPTAPCETETTLEDSCYFFGCSASNSQCDDNYVCVCLPGYCATDSQNCAKNAVGLDVTEPVEGDDSIFLLEAQRRPNGICIMGIAVVGTMLVSFSWRVRGRNAMQEPLLAFF